MIRILVIAACLVVVFAGIKVSAPLLAPFLLAVFLAIILSPPIVLLERAGLPLAAAFSVVILGLGVLGVLGGTVLRTAIDQFIVNLPSYEANLRVQLGQLEELLKGWGVSGPGEFVNETLNLQFAMSYAGTIARALSGMLGQTFIILLLTAFMLFEANGLHRKVRAIPDVSPEYLDTLEANLRGVRRYVSLKAVMSFLTGALVVIWLYALGIDNALFMGILAFFLNFVPSIGSIIAAVPGVLLGFILLGPIPAVITAIGYVVINVGVSNVIEPRFMGDRLGLSALVVLLSLFFWGWLLGPIGMLLSVPLTMVVKGAMESSPAARPAAIMLGPPPPKGPDDS